MAARSSHLFMMPSLFSLCICPQVELLNHIVVQFFLFFEETPNCFLEDLYQFTFLLLLDMFSLSTIFTQHTIDHFNVNNSCHLYEFSTNTLLQIQNMFFMSSKIKIKQLVLIKKSRSVSHLPSSPRHHRSTFCVSGFTYFGYVQIFHANKAV